jgi:rhamnosyltransferase
VLRMDEGWMWTGKRTCALAPDDILAVVVSYNGHVKTVRTVEALRGHVGRVLVVDNASGTGSIVLLKSLEGHSDVSLHFLDRNRGIGFALNLAVRMARQKGFRWLLTMDQDSLADGVMVEEFRAAVTRNPDWACLAPTLVLAGIRGADRGRDEVVGYAITSGNLVRLDVFDKAGSYDEGMFVDQVDFDFSLKVRKAGFGIYRIGKAILYHELGDARAPQTFLGKFHTFHSPLRRYYSFRNYLSLAKRHAVDFPGFVGKLGLVQLLQLVTITIYGRDRVRSFRFIGRGVLDFFRNRTGPYEETR